MWSSIVHHKSDCKTCVLPTADSNSNLWANLNLSLLKEDRFKADKNATTRDAFSFHDEIKADWQQPHNYLNMPTDYRHRHNHLRPWECKKWIGGWMTTKSIITLLCWATHHWISVVSISITATLNIQCQSTVLYVVSISVLSRIPVALYVSI